MRAADDAHRAGRAVLLVIGVQDEEHVERALQRRIRLVLQLRRLEHHVQEVAGIRQLVVGIDVRHPDHVAIAEAGDGDHLGDEPFDLLLPHVLVEDVLGLGIERAERADHGDEHAHRMGVVAERVEDAFEVLVDEGVVRDRVRPRRPARPSSAARR